MHKKDLLVLMMLLSLSGCASGGRPTPEQMANNTFAECPNNYQQLVQQRLSANLIDPYSARFRFSTPEKYVYGSDYGHAFSVGLNAKNRFGGYVGEQVHEFMCLANGSVKEINEMANGMRAGFQQAGY